MDLALMLVGGLDIYGDHPSLAVRTCEGRRHRHCWLSKNYRLWLRGARF